MKKLAIITARGGSKRIPRKNIKDFLGKPIIAYSIETALKSELFDEVMVSTEDEEIAQIAQQYGAVIPFLRSNKNADDFSGTADVLIEVINEYRRQGKEFDICCGIYPTAPFITIEILEKALELLTLKKLDVVFPVGEFSSPIQRALKKNIENKVSMFEPSNLMKRSQDLEKAYFDAGQFYMCKTDTLLEKKRLWTDNTGVITLSTLQVQDIDNIEDWKMAEFKYQWIKQQS
ncbi:pseudaminic acid cytidylyltransferase [Bernardetia sp. Wsw4-3y2]|uniref:pseudaminic acid cytidylyltransferase n=1 Tax=unclassified Bernardetia TaxID=2647129 RepID=UPI0030CBEF33